MNAFIDTIDDIRNQAARHDAVIVACSFGHDSLVLMDLVVKHFERVEAFYMAIVPGLSISEKWKRFSVDRWGVEVREVLHWDAAVARASGNRCMVEEPTSPIDFRGVIEENRKHFGIDFVCTGTRADESLRRRMLINQGKWPGDWHPLFHWRNKDIESYISTHNIPKPDQPENRMSGISLRTESLLWLHDLHPEDFATVCKSFPMAEAVVKRREWYGVGKRYDAAPA